MPDIKHLFLPALAGSKAFQEPREAGHWHRSNDKILQGISNAMEVSDASRDRGVSSVPSAWARPLLFQTALQNQAHPLHDETLQEWRGMMSLLALRDVRDLGIDVVGVPVTDGSPLGRALRKLSPPAVLLEPGADPYEWTDVLLVRYEGARGPVPLGALSPATLVYTATEYASALDPGDLPSLRDPRTGRLRAPEGADDLGLVSVWLGHLHGVLNRTPHAGGAHNTALNTLNGLIHAWLQELSGPAAALDGAAGVADAPVQVVTPQPIRYRVYRELLRPLKRDPRHNRPATTHSDLVLKSTRDQSPRRPVIVVTEKLLERGYRIWDRKRLNHLGGSARSVLQKSFAGTSGEGIWRPTDLADEGAIWVRPESYFLTDSLLTGEGGAPLLAPQEEAGNFGTRFLLPFKREILDFFSPEDIRERLSPQWGATPDGDITFSFSLPLAGPEGSVRVEKTYRRPAGGEGGRIVQIPVPVVELFPNYPHERWRRYYLFEGSTHQVKVTPVLRRRDGREAAQQVREREGSLGPFNGGSAMEPRVRVRLTEISGDDAFPEALAFARPSGEEGEQWGLLLLARDTNARGFSGHGRVGIDLGTSNTNLKWRNVKDPERIEEDDANPDRVESWTFDFPRYLRSPMARTDEERDRLMERFFVPERKVELPIPTSLRVFELARTEHLLLDYFVYFTSISPVPAAADYRYPPDVYTNIKWGGDKEKMRAFAESLLFLVLIEAISQEHPKQVLELAKSYPRSFSGEERMVMEQAWESCTARLLDGPGAVFAAASEEPAQRVEIRWAGSAVEGLAAGRYFSSRHTLGDNTPLLRHADRIAVCLDVGGGTTDISVWRGGHIIFDSSIRLAGEQVSAMVQRSQRLQELLLPPEAVTALQECRETDPFAARLNIALRNNESHVYARLRENATRSEIRWIRQAIALQFTGIVYYLASVLSAAARTPKGDGLLDNLAENGIKIFWGGNASKLIRWIDYGDADESLVASQLRSAVLYNALLDIGIEVRGEIRQVPSQAHKSEAAGGLLVMDLAQAQGQAVGAARKSSPSHFVVARSDAPETSPVDQPPGNASGIVSGERLELVSGVVEPTEILTDAGLFQNGSMKFNSRLDMLSRFVEIFNGVGVNLGFFSPDRAVELGETQRHEIRGAVEEAFVRAQRLEQKRRVIEPVFVLELRELLRWMAASGK